MYSESDIDAAVTAGAITPGAAAAFRDHVAASRASPAVDEEQFRLVTGFNDIFVTIAIVLLLVALAQIGGAIAAMMGGALVAGAAWLLSEYFTRRRRMALPSIALLLAFVGGVAAMLSGVLNELTGNYTTGPFAVDAATQPGGINAAAAMLFAGVAALTALGAWLHWRRFHVPITIAAGAVAVVAFGVALLTAAAPSPETPWAGVFTGGLATFALAMRWDLSDRERRTRRSDVAFWLHLAAAPLIAHPVFRLLGVFESDIGAGTAVAVLALYVAFAFVALAIDRRALLVSGLAYVLYALASLIRDTGAVELSAALTALVIGSALLCLSAFWQTIRRPVVRALGDWGERLPPVAQPFTPRPA